MHARPEIRQRLIEIKMAKWCRQARYTYLGPGCPPARARKNFWRLIKAHPETAQRLGYTATSVYE
jgi:hypothetical protein